MNHLRSKKWTAYVLTLLALVLLAAIRAPVEALEHLSLAVAVGLPALLGGQSVVDVFLARRSIPPTVRAEPRPSAPPTRYDGG